MNAVLGHAAITLGFVSSLLGAVTLAVALVRKQPALARVARDWVWLVLVAAILAVVVMERGLITRDFTLRYVADNGSTKTPPLFNVATMWGALEGSILLWALVLSGYLVAVRIKFRDRLADPLVGWALVTMLVVCTFFYGLMLGPANPFRTWTPPVGYDGPGPNPLLQNHILMAFHPPMLYLGYVGFTVPFAFAIGALVTGRVGEGWLVETRRWTLISWAFLSAGIVLGAWWSYEVLGWGGYWAWDPVENASFLPWLTATAFIHSVMVQERRGMLRVWNISLLAATFALTILGTFLTRSDVLESVHAFSESSIGKWILAFFFLIVVVTVGLIAWRGDRLRAPGRIDSPASREGAFLANNVLFGAFAFVVLLGTVFPLVTEAVNGDRVSVGPPYFERMTTPIGLTLLFLMAVAPVLPWRKASGELLADRLQWPMWAGTLSVVVALLLGARGLEPLLAFGLGGFAAGAAVRQLVLATRRQGIRGLVGRTNGGMVVHLGVIMIAVAIAASSNDSHQADFSMDVGDTIEFAGHELTYVEPHLKDTARTTELQALVTIDGHGPYAPALTRFDDAGTTVATPSVRTTATEDIHLSLSREPDEDTSAIQLRVTVQPMIVWLWIGGGVIVLGSILALFPGSRRRPTSPVSIPTAETVPPVDEPARRSGGGRMSAGLDTPVAPDASEVLGRHGRHTARYVSLAVGIVLAIFVGFLFTRQSDEGKATSPLLGELVPETQGVTLDGSSFDIDDHRGEWVAVNFFAHWCGPCRQEHPELVEFAARHAAAGDGSVVSVAFDDSPDKAREFFEELGGDWPVMAEDTARVGVDYGVTGVPETYLVAPDGTVVAKWAEPVTADALDDAIAELS